MHYFQFFSNNHVTISFTSEKYEWNMWESIDPCVDGIWPLVQMSSKDEVPGDPIRCSISLMEEFLLRLHWLHDHEMTRNGKANMLTFLVLKTVLRPIEDDDGLDQN